MTSNYKINSLRVNLVIDKDTKIEDVAQYSTWRGRLMKFFGRASEVSIDVVSPDGTKKTKNVYISNRSLSEHLVVQRINPDLIRNSRARFSKIEKAEKFIKHTPGNKLDSKKIKALIDWLNDPSSPGTSTNDLYLMLDRWVVDEKQKLINQHSEENFPELTSNQKHHTVAKMLGYLHRDSFKGQSLLERIQFIKDNIRAFLPDGYVAPRTEPPPST